MERRQILQNLFGYQSEEEDANLKDEFDHLAKLASGGELWHDSEGKIENKGEAEVSRRLAGKGVYHDHFGSSSSPNDEKGEDSSVHSAAISHDVLGDSGDDEPGEYAILNRTDEKILSPKYKESQVENVIYDEDATYECEQECTETKVKGSEIALTDVFEIPLCCPPVAPDEMAVIKLSNIIGIDPKPFDRMTFVDEELYVIDECGSRRYIPHTNIIRWREVKNRYGTASVESNARFITWSDGSVQLAIGNETFDISEQDTRDIQSQLFLKHEKGIYQSQGKIQRKMKFMPSSLSSNSHRSLAAMVESRNKKANKVKSYISEVDPERMMEQNKKVERETSKASKQLNKKKKKVNGKYRPKGRNERQLTPGFLEDVNDEDNGQKSYEPPTSLRQLDLGPEMEPKVEKRIMNAKKGTNGIRNSAVGVELTRGSLNVSNKEKFELEYRYKGKAVEDSSSHVKVQEMEGEVKEPYEDSDAEAEVSDNFSK